MFGTFGALTLKSYTFLIQWTQDPLNHPPPVLTSLYQPMEWSATIWGLLVWDQWTLWPPIPVSLATLSMESPPELVGVMECGVVFSKFFFWVGVGVVVGHLPIIVMVSGMNFVLLICWVYRLPITLKNYTFIDTVNTGPTETPTTCPDLTVPTNGVISYNMGTANLRPVDTVATYTCVTGYTLDGDTTRTCGSDGVWSSFSENLFFLSGSGSGSGSPPNNCYGKWNELCTACLLSVSSPNITLKN